MSFVPLQDLASRCAAVKLSTYSFISAAHSHTKLCSAGNPSTTPHIPKAVAKELNKELQQCGWAGNHLSEKICGVKVSIGTLHHGTFQIPLRSLLSAATLLSSCSVRTMCFPRKSGCQLLMLHLTRCSVHLAPAISASDTDAQGLHGQQVCVTAASAKASS